MFVTQPAKTSCPSAPVPIGFGGFAWQNFAFLLALHLPGDEVAFIITHFILNLFTLPQEKLDLSPRVAAAYKEVSNYQDLLLLGDLATITQERPYSWISGAGAGADEGREQELEGGRKGLQAGHDMSF